MNRIAFLSFIFFFAANVVAEEPSVIRVRVALNVPLSGVLASYGNAIAEGVSLATEPGGCAQGAPVQFSFENNQSQSTQAVTIAKKQLLESPQIYVTGIKPQYLAIHDIVRDSGIPHFVYVFDMNLRPRGENNFRTWANFKAEPALFIDYAKKRQAKRVALLYVQLPHTEEAYMGHFIPGLKKAGFNDPATIAYSMEETDFRGIAARLKALNPDLIFVSGFPNNLVSIIRAFRSLRLIQDGNVIVSFDMHDTAPMLNAAELEGIRASTPAFLLNSETEPVRSWLGAFRKRYSKEPIYTHAYAYDMACIIGAASRRTNSTAINELSNTLMSTDMKGISGNLKFDSTGDLIPNIELGVFRNEKVVRE